MSFDPNEYCPYVPYKEQDAAMRKIYDALDGGKIYLLEGACGTGKTLAALIPAISLAKSTDKLIVIATNINEQKQQFITEARTLHEKANLKIVVMGAKMMMCYFNNILKTEGEDEEEVTYNLCEKKRDTKECIPHFRVKGEPIGAQSEDEAKRSAVELNFKFEHWVFSSVRTPSEIAAWGVENEACSYKLALTAIGKADIVICDIRMILNPRFMPVLEFYSGKSLNEMILICDEAHNIGKIAKEVYERGISESTLRASTDEITELQVATEYMRGAEIATLDLDRTKTFIQDVLLQSLVALKIPDDALKKVTPNYKESVICFADPDRPYHDRPDKFLNGLWENTKGFMQTDFNKNPDDLKAQEEFMKRLDNLNHAGDKIIELAEQLDPEHDEIPACKSIAHFIYDYLDISKKNGYWPYLSIRSNRKGEIKRRINIHLSLPEIITAPVFKGVYAAVLMSATLAPFDILKDELGIERETVEQSIGLQFPISNRQTYVVLREVKNDPLAEAAGYKYPLPDTLTSKNSNNPASIKYIRDGLDAILEVVRHNVLIFFTNKSQAAKYSIELKNKYGGRVLLDPGGKTTAQVKQLFFEMGEKQDRGILCTYIGGTLSEGVDFKDKRAHVVVIVGVGYTQGNFLVTADETAYKVKFNRDNVYDLVVQIPTIRKVRQAMGRIIRGNEDYGVRILLDARYYRSKGMMSVHKFFPVEESKEFKVRSVTQLRDALRRDFVVWGSKRLL
jgi:DNA excision repair protein ERCC-2